MIVSSQSQVTHANQIQQLRAIIEQQKELLQSRGEAEEASRRTLHERVVALARLVEAMAVKVRNLTFVGRMPSSPKEERFNGFKQLKNPPPQLKLVTNVAMFDLALASSFSLSQMFDLQGRLDLTQHHVSRMEDASHGQSNSIGILGGSEAQSLQQVRSVDISAGSAVRNKPWKLLGCATAKWDPHRMLRQNIMGTK